MMGLHLSRKWPVEGGVALVKGDGCWLRVDCSMMGGAGRRVMQPQILQTL